MTTAATLTDYLYNPYGAADVASRSGGARTAGGGTRCLVTVIYRVTVALLIVINYYSSVVVVHVKTVGG